MAAWRTKVTVEMVGSWNIFVDSRGALELFHETTMYQAGACGSGDAFEAR